MWARFVRMKFTKKMAKKHQEEEQTAIDKLNSNLGSASEKIANNKKIIYIVIGVIAAVAAFVLSYLFIYRNPKLNKAFEAYNQVEITALGNDSIASAEYKKVADNYAGTTAGELAALEAAEYNYNLGNYQEALKYIDKFSTPEPVLAANALVLKGDILVELDKNDEALKAFESAVKKADKNPEIVPRVLLKEASIYTAQKKLDKALECYETIKKDYGQFQFGNGMDIDAYIARLKAELAK